MEDLRKRIEELEAELEDCRQSYEDEKYRAEQYRDLFFEASELLKEMQYAELTDDDLARWAENVQWFLKHNTF